MSRKNDLIPEVDDALNLVACSFEDLELQAQITNRKSDCALNRLLPEYKRQW